MLSLFLTLNNMFIKFNLQIIHYINYKKIILYKYSISSKVYLVLLLLNYCGTASGENYRIYDPTDAVRVTISK